MWQKEKMAVEDEEKTARQPVSDEEQQERSVLTDKFSTEREEVRKRDHRREVLRSRRAFREKMAENEGVGMLAADNDSWRYVRCVFERSMEFAHVSEEASEWRDLMERRHRDRTRILNNVCERRRMEQAEQRARSESERDESCTFNDFCESIHNSTALFDCEWSWALRRTSIVDEMQVAYDDLASHGRYSLLTAQVLTANPRAKLDRCQASQDVPFVLWMKQSVVPWYFGCTGVPLLSGATLKNEKGATVTDVVQLSLTCEVLNPLPGDIVHSELVQDDSFVSAKLEAYYSGSTGALLESLRYWHNGPTHAH